MGSGSGFRVLPGFGLGFALTCEELGFDGLLGTLVIGTGLLRYIRAPNAWHGGPRDADHPCMPAHIPLLAQNSTGI